MLIAKEEAEEIRIDSNNTHVRGAYRLKFGVVFADGTDGP